jgi:hypothetical protein
VGWIAAPRAALSQPSLGDQLEDPLDVWVKDEFVVVNLNFGHDTPVARPDVNDTVHDLGVRNELAVQMELPVRDRSGHWLVDFASTGDRRFHHRRLCRSRTISLTSSGSTVSES